MIKFLWQSIFLSLAALSHVQTARSQEPDQSHRRLGCRSQELPKFDSGVRPQTVTSFVALGDTPYKMRDRYCLNHQLRNLDLRNGPKFTIHVGDIKDSPRDIPCDERLYSDVADIFTHPENSRYYDPKDLFFVVGDNEWVDCKKPDDAWNLWTKYFGPGNRDEFGTFSSDQQVFRQSYAERKPGVKRDENFAFFMDNVLFIGLNIVGGKEQGDESIRLAQNFEWTRDAMEVHAKKGMKAVVIMAHAVLRDEWRITHFADPLFALLRNKYTNLPVMYLHGDGHEYCVRYPDASNSNYVDVMVDEGGFANPILVSVLRNPETDEHIFAVDRRNGLYNPDGTSEDISECPIIEKQTWNVTVETDPTDTLPKELKWKGFDASARRGACEGRCKNDGNCQPGLKCFLRDNYESVPGCLGRGGLGRDFCYDPSYGEPALAPSLVQAPSPKPTRQLTLPPTRKVTPRPTPTPPAPSSELELKYVGKSPFDSPLGICEGGCKRNDDCQKGLYCFTRRRFNPVPGCRSGGRGDRRDKNFCIPKVKRTPAAPPPAPSPPSQQKLELVGDADLDVCEGDCDKDGDCKRGLSCFQRNGFVPIPGCSGAGVSGKDYCFDPPSDALLFKGKRGIPDSAFPLQMCQGYCNRDSDCGPGLQCFQRQGYQEVPGCTGGDKGKADKGYCYKP